jgi:fructose-1,6-bisphosphatase/inositol monophosphatase family enzyme
MTVSDYPPDITEKILRTALAASVAVRHYFESGRFTVHEKGDRSLLTEADILANRICEYGLARIFPDGGWLSEESVDEGGRLSLERVWIVDPIDGTFEFVQGNPEFSVSIGLADSGRAVSGAVALPADQRIIYGGLGRGVRSIYHTEPAIDPELYRRKDPEEIFGTLDAISFFQSIRIGSPCSVSQLKDLTQARILVSQTEWNRGKFSEIQHDLRIEPGGSIARKLALLAAGEGDLVVSLNPKNDWDICGGTALIQEAGGVVFDLENFEPRTYNTANTLSVGLVAGNPILVNSFIDYFRKKNIQLE